MDSIALPFLFYVLLFVPGLGVYSWYYLQKKSATVPKPKRYRFGISSLVWLLVLTLVVAAAHKITLFPPTRPSARAWVLGTVFLAAMLGAAGLRLRYTDEAAASRMRLFLPENPTELWYWVPVAVLAGVAEECAYRGVAYVLLLDLFGSAWLSVTICTLAFAVAHIYQGWKSSLEVGALGLLSQFAVFLTGSLYLSIAAHAIYDTLLGCLVMRSFLGVKLNSAKSETTAF